MHRDDIRRDRRSAGDAAGDNTDDDTDDDSAGGSAEDVGIPVLRPLLGDLPVISPPAAEDSRNEPSENGLVEPHWRYDQQWTRGKRRRYNGYVDRIGGVEGQRLRESLAAAIRDLLDWAAPHAENPDSNDDSDGDSTEESGKDSSRDGGADDTPA